MAVSIRNKRAFYNFEILEKVEAGIKLKGYEVKAIKEGKGNLTGSFIKIMGGEVWLIGLNIPLYSKTGSNFRYDPKRTRKLLLKRSEIKSLQGKVQRKGYTLAPLKIYQKGDLIKAQVGLVKGKKKKHRKEDLIKKQQDKEIRRLLKTRG